MITPVRPLLSRLIHISRVIGQFIVRFKLFSKRKLSIRLDLKSIMCSIQIHCLKKNSARYELFSKIINCIGQLELSWMSQSKARANEVERTPATNDIVLFKSPVTRTRKAGVDLPLS